MTAKAGISAPMHSFYTFLCPRRVRSGRQVSYGGRLSLHEGRAAATGPQEDSASVSSCCGEAKPLPVGENKREKLEIKKIK